MNTDDNNKNGQPLLKAENLVKTYAKKRLAHQDEEVRALDGVSLFVSPGTTLAIVGGSGSGKSTLAFCLACLERPDSGSIWFAETDIVKLAEKERRAIRPRIQLIFQDPVNSLNPRWTVRDILSEPFVLRGNSDIEDRRQRAQVLLNQVGLSPDMLERTPLQLSGGQRQRLAIARALALEPCALILDEALSALDCSVQAQIANLLMELQSSRGMTYVFVSHDLAMAGHLADEIAVMSRGRIVEQGPPDRILKQPQSETARELLTAVPRMSFTRPEAT